MLKNRLFELEKKSEKKVKTQMRPTFFRDLHLISLFKYEKNIWIFIDRVQWTHLTMVPKVTSKELLSYVYQNQDRIVNNVFDTLFQKNYHEVQLSFPVY